MGNYVKPTVENEDDSTNRSMYITVFDTNINVQVEQISLDIEMITTVIVAVVAPIRS